MLKDIDLGMPLALVGRKPVVYPVLGAVLHLERLMPEDEARLDVVNDMVWDWFGDALRWVNRTFDNALEPAQRADLDFISGYPSSLDVPPASAPGQVALAAYRTFTRDDFGVALCGGDSAGASSPYSYRFWAETVDLDIADADVESRGVLHITVPEAWPLADFRQRILGIAAALRLRWGAAGYTYAPWYVLDPRAAGQRTAAHARRFPGYDVAEYVRLIDPFFYRIRTVNWLNFVGPAFMTELKNAGRTLEASSLLHVESLGDCVLVQAGRQPERGDVNRLQYPPAYVEADAVLRPIRARDGRKMVFFGPWQEPEITAWLCRLEQIVS